MHRGGTPVVDDVARLARAGTAGLAARAGAVALGALLLLPGCGGGGGGPTTPAPGPTVAPPTGPAVYGPIGVGLEGIGGRGLEFVDAAKTLRPWESLDGGNVPLDPAGWPLGDARTVFFDLRPFGAWLPEGPDDPDAFQIDVSGSYSLSFRGQADLRNLGGGFSIENVSISGNTTTADIVVPPGEALVIVGFANTGGGVRDVRLIRPGYPADTGETFHRPFLAALAPFSVLRFMDFTQTNNSNPPFPEVTRWSERKLPSDATQHPFGAKRDGAAWEHVVDLANASGRDAWINVPVSADDDYVRELARLFQRRLSPGLRLYVEHSNEVWNPLFDQYDWNLAAAQAEVAAGGSPLADDGVTAAETLAGRRHARRTREMGRLFAEVFGDGALGTRVRVVLSWWAIYPERYRDQLAWLDRVYGPPSHYLTAIAEAPYFSSEGASPTASPRDILAVMARDSDASRTRREQLQQVADEYGLRHFGYEGGPDSGGGSTANIESRIRAHRDPGMESLVIRDLAHNWYPLGGDLFMYFTLTSAYSRWGMWGATEDVANLDTPKMRALHRIAAQAPPEP